MPMPERLELPAATHKAPEPLTSDALAAKMKPGAPPALVPAVGIIADFRPPFFLYHHPNCWDLSSTHGGGNERLKQPTLLPQVQMFPIAPGAFGCRTRRQGEPFSAVYAKAVEKWQRDRGVTFLDPEQPIPSWALPPGVPEGGYLRELEVVHPLTDQQGSRWSEVWHVPAPTQPNTRQHFEFRRTEYELWLAWLVQSGQLRPASRRAFEVAVKKWRHRVEGVVGLSVSAEVREVMLARRQPWLDAAQNATPVEELPTVAGEVAA